METAVEENHKEKAENTAPDSKVEEKSPLPPPPATSQEPPKKSKKEDRLKKDDKNVDQFMKSLNSVPTIEEKFSVVCKKYVQGADENKKLQFYIKQSDKRYALLLKEKEQLQHEFNKTILVKSKLENLCRELQKQNKAIKEESLLKIREEEERRKETQAKFQNTLSEISTLLQQNNEKNAKLRDDNISMTEKFKSVVEQYQLREQQVDKMAAQMLLESRLYEAKLEKANLEHQAEKERINAEMEQMKASVARYKKQILELQRTELSLVGQLGVYTDKYDEFQSALVKSNQVFGGFKEQMEKMSKKIKTLEKESLSWKSRWETSQTALLDMCGERQASEERVAATSRQLHHMQSLCRTLQAERTVLLGALKENNIERPPLPAQPPQPPQPPQPQHQPASNAKVDAMAANCVQLRQSLAHLQSQLNVLTNNKNGNKEEPPKQEKAKKSKSKKNKEKQARQEQAGKAVEATEDKPAESEPSSSEIKAQIEPVEDKVNDKTLESLIQAINSANINICDLDVDNDGNDNGNDEVLEIEVNNETNTNVSSKTNQVTDENVVSNVNLNETANGDTETTVEVSVKGNSNAESNVFVNENVGNSDVNVIETANGGKDTAVEISTKVNSNEELNVPVNENVGNSDVNVNETANGGKETAVEVSTKVNSNAELNVSVNEVNSNDEVSHIAEVKPIPVDNS